LLGAVISCKIKLAMGLFEKTFCKHKWKSHNKQERTLSERVPYTDRYVVTKEFTREVLVCEKCGKIKQIEY
jgi:hypothetical protein